MTSPTSPRAPRRRTTVAAIALSGALLLAGCGASGGSAPTKATAPRGSTTTAPAQDAAEALHDAANATLEASSFDVQVEANLEVGVQTVHLDSSGPVDYDKVVADVEINVEQGSTTQKVKIRSDGTRFWVQSEKPGGPTLPDGKSWVEGPVSRLKQSATLQPSGLVGVVLALLGAKDAKATGTAKIDGETVRTYRTTVLYQDAVDAAGDRAPAFQSALSLRGDPGIELDIDVAVGSDGIVRKLSLDVKASKPSIALGGDYRVELKDVNKPVDKPDAPPAKDTVTGPTAKRLIEQLID